MRPVPCRCSAASCAASSIACGSFADPGGCVPSSAASHSARRPACDGIGSVQLATDASGISIDPSGPQTTSTGPL